MRKFAQMFVLALFPLPAFSAAVAISASSLYGLNCSTGNSGTPFATANIQDAANTNPFDTWQTCAYSLAPSRRLSLSGTRPSWKSLPRSLISAALADRLGLSGVIVGGTGSGFINIFHTISVDFMSPYVTTAQAFVGQVTDIVFLGLSDPTFSDTQTPPPVRPVPFWGPHPRSFGLSECGR